MELMSLKQFYEGNENKDVSLYQEYLASAKKEICEGLKEVKKIFGEDDDIVVQIIEQINVIKNLEVIIRKSIKEIFNNSIRRMSEEELESIIVYYHNNMDDVYKELEKKSKELKEKINENTQEYTNKMYELGYKYSYYEAVDAEEFFEEIKSDEFFIMDLVKSSWDDESLKEMFSCLYQNYNYDVYQYESIAKMIISLRKIAKVSDDAILKKAILSYLTSDKFRNIIGEKDASEGLKVFEILQTELKMQTEFFKNLPDSLQKEIRENGIADSETYKRLALIYSQYKVDGRIVKRENDEVKKYENELENVNKIMSELESKLESATRAIGNRTKLIEFVATLVEDDNDEKLTYRNVSIEAFEQREKEKELSERINTLNEELKELEEIQSKLNVLLSEDGLEFDILQAKRECNIENDDKEISAIAKAERRRLKQFKILAEGIVSLKSIQANIYGVTEDHSISNTIKNVIGANRKLKEELLEKYKKETICIYDRLKSEDLLYINVARSDKDIDDEARQRPSDFEALLASSNVPKYEVSEELFKEMKENKMLPVYCSKDALNVEFETANYLALKLFKAAKMSNGTYDFEIYFSEIRELIKLYEYLVSVYEAISNFRVSKRNRILDLAKVELSDEFRRLIKDTGFDLTTVTFSDVKGYYMDILRRISDLYDEMMDLKEELPKYDDSLYELLNGFEETHLSSTEVKKIIKSNC